MSSGTAADSLWATQPLDKKRHDRDRFDCGVPVLDTYLQTQAAQEMRRRAAVTYVLEDPNDPGRIRGYYTLSSNSAALGALPEETARKMASYPRVSAILLGRLAVDERDRAQGLGGLLLVDALRRACTHSAAIGAALVVVEAKDEAAVRFYQHYGFRTFPDNHHQLFLTMLEAGKV